MSAENPLDLPPCEHIPKDALKYMVGLIRKVYEFNDQGGNLHIVLADWNIDDKNVMDCFREIENKLLHVRSTEILLQLLAERTCIEYLANFTPGQRRTAIEAYEEEEKGGPGPGFTPRRNTFIEFLKEHFMPGFYVGIFFGVAFLMFQLGKLEGKKIDDKPDASKILAARQDKTAFELESIRFVQAEFLEAMGKMAEAITTLEQSRQLADSTESIYMDAFWKLEEKLSALEQNTTNKTK